MEKRRLISGIVIGTIVGTTFLMANKNVRQRTKKQLDQTIDKTSKLIKQPSRAVSDLREGFNKINKIVSSRANQVISTLGKIEEGLEKVEQTLGKFTHKN